jgi:sulfate adenylyltransferase large subunit
MATFATPVFAIEEFLSLEREKDLFRFSTAGSVDDGKSTLIGRLLYDTQSVYEDQVRAIEGKGTTAPGQIDFALLTDGLRAEREQGITIDVAYRYFSTLRRKFIIADTPGHEQYTRNMATGASTADATVVLLDASKGVLLQSRRHAYIASLLKVRHVVVAVNKMDLIGYDQLRFEAIERDFRQVLEQIASETGNAVEPVFVPVSALVGDNIVHRSQAMPWYDGPSLLEVLETLPRSQDTGREPFRFPVQRVIRPDHTFRGFAGQIASGTIRPGDAITVLPSGRSAKVARIVTWDGDLAEADAPLSVTLTLDTELDISRGDLITSASEPAPIVNNFEAALVWMDQRPLERNRRYLLKHTSHTVPAVISELHYRTDIGSLSREPANALEMNGIGAVRIQLLRPIAVDTYGNNRNTGAFIIIDTETNSTVAAGMVTRFDTSVATGTSHQAEFLGPVSNTERAARWGHRGAVVKLSGSGEIIDRIERLLFDRGAVTCRIHSSVLGSGLEADRLTEFNAGAGFLVLLTSSGDENTLTIDAEGQQIALAVGETNNVASSAIDFLIRTEILADLPTGRIQ